MKTPFSVTAGRFPAIELKCRQSRLVRRNNVLHREVRAVWYYTRRTHDGVLDDTRTENRNARRQRRVNACCGGQYRASCQGVAGYERHAGRKPRFEERLAKRRRETMPKED